MNAKELIISIKSFFDSKGAEEAKRSISAIGDAAGKSDKNLASVGKEASGTAAKMQGAAASASALAGALGQGQGGVATAARTAAGALAALRAGWIGIAIAIVTVVVSAVTFFKDKSEKALSALKTQQDAFHRGLQRSADLKLDNLVRQYKDSAEAAGNAADAADRLLDANTRLADARNERALAEIDAEEAAALNKVDPQDEIAVEKVKLDYSKKREEIQTRSAIADAKDARDAAKDKVTSGEDAERKALNNLRSLKQLRDQNPSEKADKAVETAQAELATISAGVAASRIDVVTANERVGTALAKRSASQASLSGRSSALDDRVNARDDERRSAQDKLADLDAARSSGDMEKARSEVGVSDAESTYAREQGQADRAQAALASFRPGLTRIGGRIATRPMMAAAADRESAEAAGALAELDRAKQLHAELLKKLTDQAAANNASTQTLISQIANSRTSD